MKRMIIMGATSAMGLRLAETLASRGVMVGLAARHTEPLAELQKKYPDYVRYASIDISQPAAVQQLYQLIDDCGGMDIYFHVSGIGYQNLTLDPEKEVAIVNTNMGGFVRMLAAAYRWFFAKEQKGQIAAITSVAGTKGIGRLAAYSATKCGASQYMDALEQLAYMEGAGISFSDIRPGWVRTHMTDNNVRFPMEMDADYASRLILKAIVRKKRVAVIDWRWNLAAGLLRLFPNAIWTRHKMNISTPDIPLPRSGDIQIAATE